MGKFQDRTRRLSAELFSHSKSRRKNNKNGDDDDDESTTKKKKRGLTRDREEEEEDLFTLSVVYSPEERERETIQTKQRSNVLRERERERPLFAHLF